MAWYPSERAHHRNAIAGVLHAGVGVTASAARSAAAGGVRAPTIPLLDRPSAPRIAIAARINTGRAALQRAARPGRRVADHPRWAVARARRPGRVATWGGAAARHRAAHAARAGQARDAVVVRAL